MKICGFTPPALRQCWCAWPVGGGLLVRGLGPCILFLHFIRWLLRVVSHRFSKLHPSTLGAWGSASKVNAFRLCSIGATPLPVGRLLGAGCSRNRALGAGEWELDLFAMCVGRVCVCVLTLFALEVSAAPL